MTTINIHEFSKRYSDNYEWLYNYDGSDYNRVVSELCDIFDNYFLKKHKQFITDFVIFRGYDPISSDRECAAFVLTMEEMVTENVNY